MSMQLPIRTLASVDSAEGRFLTAADQAGDKNGQVTVEEIHQQVAAKPDQADLIGKARIADWTTRISKANPGEATPQARQQDIYTAPLGPNALDVATRYANMLKGAGLKVSDLQVIQRINIGKITGARVVYETPPTNPQVQAAARAQGIGVNFFGDCISETERFLSALKVSNAVVLDVRITSTFGTGKIAGMQVTYVSRADYDRNTTG